MSDLRNQAGTPWPLFNTLHEEYQFNVDVCAVAHNAKLPNYFTPEDDSLALDWSGFRIWCNPPFNDIPPWLEHSKEPELVCYLLPSRTDRIWFGDWKPLAETHYLVGESPCKRPQFVPPPGVKYSSNSMSLLLFLFGKGCTPGKEVWRCGKTGERL